MFCLISVSSLASLETDGGGIGSTRTAEGNATPSLFLLKQLFLPFSLPIKYFTALHSGLYSFR